MILTFLWIHLCLTSVFGSLAHSADNIRIATETQNWGILVILPHSPIENNCAISTHTHNTYRCVFSVSSTDFSASSLSIAQSRLYGQDKTHTFTQGICQLCVLWPPLVQRTGPRRSIYWNFRGIKMFGRQLSDLACAWGVRKNWVGVSQIILFISLSGKLLRSLKQDVERDGVISSVKWGVVLCSKSDNEFPTWKNPLTTS